MRFILFLRTYVRPTRANVRVHAATSYQNLLPENSCALFAAKFHAIFVSNQTYRYSQALIAQCFREVRESIHRRWCTVPGTDAHLYRRVQKKTSLDQ